MEVFFSNVYSVMFSNLNFWSSHIRKTSEYLIHTAKSTRIILITRFARKFERVYGARFDRRARFSIYISVSF